MLGKALNVLSCIIVILGNTGIDGELQHIIAIVD